MLSLKSRGLKRKTQASRSQASRGALAPGLFIRAFGYGINQANAGAVYVKRPPIRIRRIKSPGADAPRLAWTTRERRSYSEPIVRRASTGCAGPRCVCEPNASAAFTTQQRGHCTWWLLRSNHNRIRDAVANSLNSVRQDQADGGGDRG